MSRDILLEKISPDPNQPRKQFDDTALSELAQSIKENGLAVPILLRPEGNKFIIVHGERRFRAVSSLGWSTIPAEVRDIDAEQAEWLALVENIQRDDLTPIEEAKAYKARLDSGLTQKQLGEKIGKSQSYIATKLRLLKMPQPLQTALDHGFVTEGHIKQLLRLKKMHPRDLMADFDVLDEYPEYHPTIAFNGLRPFDNNKAILAAILPGEDQDASPLYWSFVRYLQDNDGKIPQWVVCAVWWSVFTYHANVSVTLLSDQITLWGKIIWSGVFVLPGLEKSYTSGDMSEYSSIRYWGHYSDLRHAGFLEYALTDPDYDKRRLHNMKPLFYDGLVYAPYSCQFGGFSYEKYSKIREGFS